MEERRRQEDKNWAEVIDFINESRAYRAADKVRQDYQTAKIESIEKQTIKTNGRVDRLEDFQKSVETKIKDRKEIKDNWIGWATLIALCIPALIALWAFLNHKGISL